MLTNRRFLTDRLSCGARIAGPMAALAVIFSVASPASAQQTTPPPAPNQGTTAPVPAPKSGVVVPPNVDPKMAQPVPNVDPGISKPPPDPAKPIPTEPPKTPPDVQPR
jgi:hypothetical protein